MNFKSFYRNNIINEALLGKHRQYMDYGHYITKVRALRKDGWTLVGSGSYAQVFEKKGKNYVIKIYADDDGYDLYLKFIEKNKNNPALPKIRRILSPHTKSTEERLGEYNHRYGIIAMEKLTKLYMPHWMGALIDRFSRVAQKVSTLQSFDDFISELRDRSMGILNASKARYEQMRDDELQGLSDDEIIEHRNKSFRLRRIESDIVETNKRIRRTDYFIETQLNLFKTFYELIKFLRESGKYDGLDLHSANFMLRPSTGEIVITDPLAF